MSERITKIHTLRHPCADSSAAQVQEECGIESNLTQMSCEHAQQHDDVTGFVMNREHEIFFQRRLTREGTCITVLGIPCPTHR